MKIATASTISIKIISAPRSVAARKTLRRICAKDPAVARAKRARKSQRPSWESWRRGGKQWHHQMKSRVPVPIEPGAEYTVSATVDVLRDLESVQRYVTISRS